MSLLKQRFEEIQKKYPNASSYIHFVKAIKGREYSKRTIQRWFNELVDKDDYAPCEKRDIVDFVLTL